MGWALSGWVAPIWVAVFNSSPPQFYLFYIIPPPPLPPHPPIVISTGQGSILILPYHIVGQMAANPADWETARRQMNWPGADGKQRPLGYFRRQSITKWILRLTRLERKTTIASITVPGRLPRKTCLGIVAGMANMARLNRLTRLTSTTRRLIPGKLVKW